MKKTDGDEKGREAWKALGWLLLLVLLIVGWGSCDYACWRAQHPDAPTWSYGCHCLDNKGGSGSKRK